MTASARWVLSALALAASRASAQDVRGVVRDSSTQQAIAGVVVMLQDASGRALGRGITNDRGQFRVAMAQGAQQLRAVRIGFRPRVVPVVGGATIDVTLAPLPSLLEPIQVSDVTRCSKRSDRAAALALWEQIRTGLLAAVVGREANPANMRRLQFDRLYDRSGKLHSQSVHIDSARTDRAFGAALPVTAFLRDGFKSDSAGLDVFYGPDADILLSDEFAAGYCFRIADRDASRPGQIGLGFAPAERKRERTDIEGTLWVDSIARRLVDIDYAYLGLEPRIAAFHPGGRTSFRTMANGMVLLDRWTIRLVATSADSTTEFRNRNMERTPVLQAREVGGEIAFAEWPDGTQWSAALGMLRGHATRDGAPAPGVTVHLLETDYAATTDAAGDFQLRELLPGPYEVGVENAQLAAVGLLMPTGVQFTAARDSTQVVAVPIPSLDDYTWDRCTADPNRPRAARRTIRMFIVRILQPNGQPAEGVRVFVKFLGGGAALANSDIETGSSGIAQICGVVDRASNVAVIVERENRAPLEFDQGVSGPLTTFSITLPGRP
ncbi:MAG: carboxypeptidase regulatory-like domain-containing protein [Gemmatimonadaceae bacterium]